jgi:uncharacterized surface anchored protein
VTISNCGKLKVTKVTVPNPDPTDTSFSYTEDGSNNSTTLPRDFDLKNGETDSQNVFPATDFSVEEGTLPAGWNFTSASCHNQTTNTDTGSLSGQTVSSIAVGVDETVLCTFTNTLQQGAIKISKTSSKTGNALDATFSITGPGGYSNSVSTGADGSVCVDGLNFGSYTVTETGAPTGFIIDDTSGHSVTVDNNASCSDDPYVGETTSFTDTPTADIQVNFRDGGSGETSGTILCDNTTGTGSNTVTSGWDTSRTVTGIHAPTTVTCTITIDP